MSYVRNLGSWENKTYIKDKKRLDGFQTLDLCDTSHCVTVHAMLNEFSYQTNWELVTLWVCNLPMQIGRYMVKMRSQVKQVPP